MRGKLFVVLIASVIMVTSLFCALPQQSAPSQQRQFAKTPPGTLGEVVDADQDGLTDVEERELHLNPQNPDSDGDGMRDIDEVRYWTNISLNMSGGQVPDWVRDRHPGATQVTLSGEWAPAGDLDGDGLPNINDSDADSDGMMDGREIALGLSPGDPDTDQDGIIDSADPHPATNADADRDGMADDWETVQGVFDPAQDADMDGQTNVQEFEAGTDPNNDFTPGDAMINLGGDEMRLQGYSSFYGSGSLTQALFQVTPIYNPRYWRLQTFDSYAAGWWTTSGAMSVYNGTLPDRSDVLSSEARNNGETYRIVINGTLTGYLPTAAHTTAVSFVEPGDQTLMVSLRATFRAHGVVVAFNLTADLQNYKDRLTSARPDPAKSAYLSTPYTASSRVRALALNITLGATTTAAKLEAIALWLAQNCRFDRSAPAASGGEDPIEHFLFDSRAGIAPEFASAYTIICRINGIPARLAVGFAPGVIRGEERYVQLGHKHAWCEVALEGIGWVGVECTPGNAEAGHGIGIGSSGIDTNILQFWDNGVEEWWYYQDRPEHVGGDGGGGVHGGFIEAVSPNATAGDSDGDGLGDASERLNGTNPYARDTDQDGLDDAYEVSIHSNARANDPDGDGLTDAQELVFGSDPGKYDTDDGGACDNQEFNARTNPRDPTDDHSSVDFDNDRISDWDERARGTDPRSPDLDGDGLTDVYEISRGTNISLSDSDSDGLADVYEVELGTDPSSADTDRDGLSDWLETTQGLDPWSNDTDGDGIDDATEYYDIELDPRVFDQDRDGRSDGQERSDRTDPQNIDTDGDGITDGQEATNPAAVAPAENLSAPYAALLGLLLVVGMAAAYAYWRRKHTSEIEDALKKAERQLMELDIDTEPDEVRRAVYRTYKQLCGVLRKYGFLRGKSVTLREFESAVGAAISIDAERLSELTGIVEEARYSDHRLSADYKDRALGCIRGILDSMGAGGGARPRRGARAAA